MTAPQTPKDAKGVPGYSTPAALAQRLNVTTRTLERWHVQNMGPPRIKIGKTVLYRDEAVDGWLKAREQPASAAA